SLTYGLVQFSGMDIQYDFKQPIGQRIQKARVNSKKIKPKRRYTVACSAFVAGGGDGFSMLKNGKVLAKSEQKFIDFLLEYIEREKEILLPDVK
ncbi:MAG: 5'-nucleotidase C-terminal domain-containing protein, partial [Saprospiraceae bacterium]